MATSIRSEKSVILLFLKKITYSVPKIIMSLTTSCYISSSTVFVNLVQCEKGRK